MEAVILAGGRSRRLAGRAAHAVVRPAAPVTTFIAGLVVGRALGDQPEDLEGAGRDFERVRQIVERLAAARD